MPKKGKLSDIFHNNKLLPKIINDITEITKYEMGNLSKEKNYSEEQILKKNIFNYFSSIQNVVNDLEKTLVFLQIDYSKILEVYSELGDKKSYYIYHFENYFIRINTITDLVGKIGNLICKTNIENEKCNGYSFKEKMITINPNLADSVSKILEHTKCLKIIRHKKIHTGESEIENLKDIVLWSDLAKYTKTGYDAILDDYTDLQIKLEICRVENEIKELLNFTNHYFDLLEIEYDNLQKDFC